MSALAGPVAVPVQGTHPPMSMQVSAPGLGAQDAAPEVSMASLPDNDSPGVVVPEGSFAAAMVLARGGNAAFADAVDVFRAVWTNADLTRVSTPDELGPSADARPGQSVEANTLMRGSLALAESGSPSGQGSRLPTSTEIQGNDPSPREKQELAVVPLTVAIASALALVGLAFVGLRLRKQKLHRRKRTRHGPMLP